MSLNISLSVRKDKTIFSKILGCVKNETTSRLIRSVTVEKTLCDDLGASLGCFWQISSCSPSIPLTINTISISSKAQSQVSRLQTSENYFDPRHKINKLKMENKQISIQRYLVITIFINIYHWWAGISNVCQNICQDEKKQFCTRTC